MFRTIRESLVSAHFESWLYSGTLSMKIFVTATLLVRRNDADEAVTFVVGPGKMIVDDHNAAELSMAGEMNETHECAIIILRRQG
jgi:hypothetical protein